MLNRPVHSPANDVEETIDSALARWSRDPGLAPLVANVDGLLLVLDEAGTRILHASHAASTLRAALGDADGRVFAAIGLHMQIARLGDLRGAPRLVRLRFDGRGLAPPATCRVARAVFGDRKALLVAPLDIPRVARPAPERLAAPRPSPDVPAPTVAPPTAGTPARFVWQSDRQGVLTRVAAADTDIVTGLEGRSWQALCAQAGTPESETLLSALREHRTFRALSLFLRLRPSGREAVIELSGAPVGRGSGANGFSGFGIIRDRDVVRSDEARPKPPSLLEPHSERRDLSTEESAAFLEIAKALGGPAPEEPRAGDDVLPSAQETTASPDVSATVSPAATSIADTLERLPLAILVHRDARVVYANCAFLELVGLADLEALKRSIGETGWSATGEGPDGDRLSLPSGQGGTIPVQVERSMIDWDGEGAELVVARPLPTAPADEPATGTGVALRPEATAVPVAAHQDDERDDDRRRLDLAARQKLDFFAKAGQQIRTPLNGIMSLSDAMLAEQFGPLGSEQYRDYLLDIQASGNRALALLGDIVELAEIEAGRIDLAFADLPLNDLVARCIAQMQPQAARDRIVFRTSLSPDLTTLLADERSLRQATLNAIAHAIRFTEPGGQIIVSTTLAERGEIALRVRDTGAGMSPSEVEQALEPFRLPMPSLSNDNASGLGLTLTKALVEANRGRFRLSSRKNEGTLVEMVFPPALSA